jgi:ribosomal protein L37AE/L43A
MSFDDDPRDEAESHPCPLCGGVVRETHPGIWECADCSWKAAPGEKSR